MRAKVLSKLIDVFRASEKGLRVHIEAAGSEDYSPVHTADAFADAVGHPVEAIAVPRAEWETLMGLTGDAGGRTAPRAEMVDGFNSGWNHFGVPGTENADGVTGATPACIFSWAYENTPEA